MANENSSDDPPEDAKQQATRSTPMVETTPSQAEMGGESDGESNCKKEPTKRSSWSSLERTKVGEIVLIVVGFAALCVYSCQLNQMIAANKLGTDTAMRQLRAYVLYVSGQVKVSEDGNSYTISVDVKNFGQTPEYDVTTFIDVGIASEQPTDFPLKETRTDISTDLGPGMSIPDYFFVFPETRHLDAPNKSKIIYVWGLIKYRDIYQRCQLEIFKSGKPMASGKVLDLETIGIATDDQQNPKCQNTPYGRRAPTPK